MEIHWEVLFIKFQNELRAFERIENYISLHERIIRVKTNFIILI